MTASFGPHVLREYALIADGERGALVGPDGAMSWLCAPGWDSPAIFSGLLGGRGLYAVTPADPWHVWGGYYEAGTLIWRSRWVGDARTECREALAMPADPHRAVILRRIVAVDGPARVSVVLDVRAGFGRSPMTGLSRSGGCWTGRSGRIRFRWSGAAKARPGPDGLTLTVTLPAGGHHDLVLELADRALPDRPPDPDQAWAATENTWSDVVPDCDDLIAARDARQCYAVLRGLTASTGAMVAAATTSLPEHLQDGRNYDYRYAWIRDQCYAGLAVAAHGPHPLLVGTVRFLTERILADAADLMPAYTVAGRPIPDERRLRLRGYPGGTARAGNQVRHQFQLDGLGESLELFAAAARLDLMAEENWHAAAIMADAIKQRWSQPDAGIWELDDRHWTHSRLTCVSGLRALAVAAQGPSQRRQAADWSALADSLAGTLTDAVHPSGRWQRSPDDERVDAALLLPVIRGALPADDPRNRATVQAVQDELTEDGYVYRFRHDARPLHKSEGAFLLCGFWLAQAAQASGDRTAAARWFERNRAACGPAGLYTEEYDVHQRQLRGNLPQAFVHAGVLETAARLSS
ncbi:MAG TPA: glycoside hydrolase family 15 protein [Streptosporangiaceae bacterium]|nr:glycoside hydrolase family 15 protein [Streptosporangiaceae bacterium]